jgi:hypothetical protein
MPGNSFQNAQTPQSLYAASAGTLHLFSDTDRSTAFDVDYNPSTSWTATDLSGQVPKGTKALYGYWQIERTDATAIIMVRDGVSTSTGSFQLRSFTQGGSGTLHGYPTVIKASDGKFETKEFSNTYEANDFHFELWGYFI